MKKILAGLALLACLTAPLAVHAEDVVLFHACANTNFLDTMRISFSRDSAEELFLLSAVRWSGADQYQLTGTGVMMRTFNEVSFQLTASLHHRTGFFGISHNCSLQAIIDPATFAGPWTMECVGVIPGAPGFPNVAVNFLTSGTMNVIPCTLEFAQAEALSFSEAQTLGIGRLAGDPGTW